MLFYNTVAGDFLGCITALVQGAAYYYRCSVVCLSVGHNGKPCKNEQTGRAAVWRMDRVRPKKNHTLGRGADPLPGEWGNLEGNVIRPTG